MVKQCCIMHSLLPVFFTTEDWDAVLNIVNVLFLSAYVLVCFVSPLSLKFSFFLLVDYGIFHYCLCVQVQIHTISALHYVAASVGNKSHSLFDGFVHYAMLHKQRNRNPCLQHSNSIQITTSCTCRKCLSYYALYWATYLKWQPMRSLALT